MSFLENAMEAPNVLHNFHKFSEFWLILCIVVCRCAYWFSQCSDKLYGSGTYDLWLNSLYSLHQCPNSVSIHQKKNAVRRLLESLWLAYGFNPIITISVTFKGLTWYFPSLIWGIFYTPTKRFCFSTTGTSPTRDM